MPARHYILGIVLFWLATTGWLFQRDLWPWFRPSDVPPFTIDLAYEAQRHASSSTWSILRGDKRIGMVHAWIKYHDPDDTFVLHSTIQQLELGQILSVKILATDMSGMYRVTRAGELCDILAEATVHVQGTGMASVLSVTAQVHMDGEVQGSRFIPHGHVSYAGQKINLNLEPVEFPSRASVLNPLHPVNRITGLRRGQHWQVRLMDPLADSVAALVQKDPALELLLQKKQGIKILHAEVLEDTQLLTYEGVEVPCLVIEYRADDMTARTWVRESDGKVLRQEASLWGERLILERL